MEWKSSVVIGLIFLAQVFNRVSLNETCTWSAMSFDKGMKKAVNSMGVISMFMNATDNKTLAAVVTLTWVLRLNGDIKMTSSCNFPNCKPHLEEDNNHIASFEYGVSSQFMVSNFTIKNLTKEYDQKNIELQNAGCNGQRNFTMSVEYCKNYTVRSAYKQDANIVIKSESQNPAYGAVTTCKCEYAEQKLNTVDGKPADATVFCNDTADWDGCNYVQCWFAPTNLTVAQFGYFASDPANFNCSFEKGFPENNTIKYFIEKEEVDWDESLSSSDHLKFYHCEVNNSYNTSASPPRVLEVYFSPQDLKANRKTVDIPINDTKEVFFTFRANPKGTLNTTFVTNEGVPLEGHSTSDGKGNWNFSYSITIKSEDGYGDYMFTVNTSDPFGIESENITITPYPSTTATPTTDPNDPNNPNNIPIIVASCAAVVVLILLAVLLVLYRKRHKSKIPDTATTREERDNPLYGESAGVGAIAEYASVQKKDKSKSSKEERVNPLYGSHSENPGRVEEAYAAVDKKAKKKNKGNSGNENAAFTSESNAAVYAAVNKPKKKKNDTPTEAVYSQVNKNKKGSNEGSSLHGTNT